MPTLRDHLQAAEDAGKGGGHHHGGHHGGGGRRHGGRVFYDRSPDVVVVTEDCPPGFYFDEFGDCRPLPYHSMRRALRPSQAAGAVDPKFLPSTPEGAGAIYDDGGGLLDEPKLIAIYDGGAGSYDMRRPTFDAAGDSAVPVGWFNPFDPIGSGAAYQTLRDRDALDAEIMTTDARVASSQKAGAKIPNEVIFDYVAFRKDWDAVKGDDISPVQLSSMRQRFRAELDKLAQYMKVDDLRPPTPLTQTIPNAVNKFGESMQTVATAGAATVIVVAVIAAILLRPLVKERAETGASLAKSFAK